MFIKSLVIPVFAFIGMVLSTASYGTQQNQSEAPMSVVDYPVVKKSSGTSDDCPTFLNHKIKKLNSSQYADLCETTKGKVVLIVNTASHCGFTPQFKELEAIHQRYKDEGLVVLGFPSDDFYQEEDKQSAIAEICFINYGVSFIMLEPVHVWGEKSHTIFRHLAEKSATPKWNFYKYVISDNGENVTAFNSKVTPNSKSMIDVVEAALAKNKS